MEKRSKDLQTWALALFSKSYQQKFCSKDGRIQHKLFQEHLKNAIKGKRDELRSNATRQGEANVSARRAGGFIGAALNWI